MGAGNRLIEGGPAALHGDRPLAGLAGVYCGDYPAQHRPGDPGGNVQGGFRARGVSPWGPAPTYAFTLQAPTATPGNLDNPGSHNHQHTLNMN